MANFYPNTPAEFREAVNSASQLSGAHKIYLKPNATYIFDSVYTLPGQTPYSPTLYASALQIAADITIIGNGATLKPDPSFSGDIRLFTVYLSSRLRLEDVIVRDFHHSYGGVIFLQDISSQDSELVDIELMNCQFLENNNTNDGGVVYASNGLKSFTVDNCIAENNQISDSGSGSVFSLSNSSETYKAPVSITNSQFTNNDGAHHGVVYIHQTRGDILVSNCDFENNDSYRGALNLDNSIVENAEVKNCTFINNTAEGSGGGIYSISSSEVLTVEGCTFLGNEAHFQGAAIYYTGNGSTDILNIIGCTIEDNASELYQGALFVVGLGQMNISSSEFINNTGDDGSAVYSITCKQIKIFNSLFDGNINSNRGTLYLSNGDAVEVHNCTFVNNIATSLNTYSEAVMFSSAGTVCTHSTFINNRNTSDSSRPIMDVWYKRDFRFNNWGTSDGPAVVGQSPTGSGDLIPADVMYLPFIGVGNPSENKGDVACPICYEADDDPKTKNPISLRLAEKQLDETDIQMNTPLGVLAFTRRYRQSQQDSLDYMGLGWSHNHLYRLVEDGGTPNKITVTLPSSRVIFYDENSDDTFEAAAGSTSVIVKTVSGYDLTASDESEYHFDTAGKLITHTLNNGEVWTYSYDGNGNLTLVSDGYGRSLEFAYYTGTSSFKDDLLWRVGALGVGQTSDLTNTTPTMPYIELDYTNDGNGDGLLTDVQDVRGEDWSYRYYGSGTGETDTKWLNFLVERFSPAVDRDGDGSADSAITIEALSYSGTARDAISQIVQNRGESLMSKTLDFDPDNDVTTETVEGLELTHHFTNGVYVGTEDDQNNAQEKAPLSNYRPAYQEDAKGNRTAMKWSADGKRLEGVVDANFNETAFRYDQQDRLLYSTNPEGRITHYEYDGVDRQPNQILVTDGQALVDDGDMSDYFGWYDLGTPSTNERSDATLFEGDYARHVVANQGDGIRSQNEVDFLAGETYLIRARIFVVNSSESVKMGIAGVSHWDSLSSTDGEWEIVEARYQPSSNISGYLQFTANSTSAEWYVDHVIVDVPHRQQEFVYDTKGRTTSEKLIDPSDGTTVLQETTRTYGTSGNEYGLLQSIAVIDSLNTLNNSTTQYTYDAQGRVIRTQKISMFGSCKYNHTVYDEAGNILGTACGLMTTTPIPEDKTTLLALYNASDSLKKYTRITTHEYDEMGRRVETTSNANTNWERINRTIYDALGRVIRTIQNYSPQGSSAPGDWVWDVTNEEWQYSSTVTTPVSHGAELDENIISDTQYNGRGLVNMRRDVFGRVTLYGYNNADRLVKTVQNASKIPLDPNVTTSYDYDMRYGGSGDPDLSEYELVASNLADEDIITETLYDPNGNVVKSIDARGSVTFTVLDALNRPVKVISNAAQASYDILSDLDLSGYGAYSTEPDKDMVSTTEYDAMGRVVQSKRLLENRGITEEWDVTYYVYDSLGRQIRTIQHYVEPPSGLTPENWVYEDTDNNLMTEGLSWKDQPTGTLIDFGDNDQNLITQTRYDIQGRVQETEDVNGRVTRVVYDGFNRQVLSIANYVAQANPPEDWEWANNQWEDGSANAINHGDNKDQNIISKTVYDDNGMVSETQNVEGLVSHNVYNDAGRSILRIQNYVEQGNPTNWEWANNQWEDGSSTAIVRGSNFDQNLISKPEYDDEQRVVETRDARGNLNRQVFDESGRTVLSIANYVAQANPPEDWEWDETNARWEDGSGNAIDHGTNKDQNRISSTEYDLLGRAFRTRDVAGRETYTVYDAVGRVVRRVQNYVLQGSSLPDDWSWNESNQQYEYSAGNAVDTGTANDQNIISETEYNQAGQVINTRDAFGTQSSFSYDEAGRRVIVTQASNTSLASKSYTCFDKAGRVLRTIANYLALYDEQAQVISPDDWDVNQNWIFNPGEHGTYRDRNIISEMVYDRASRRISSINPEGDVSQTTYFKDGQVDSMTDPEGMVTVYRYDALRRRTLVVQSFVDNGEDPENWVWNGTQYTKSDTTTAIGHGTDNDENIIVMVTYDIAGRMKSLRDPRGNLTSYTYDKLGRRTELENPLNLNWTTSYAEANGAQRTTMNYAGVNGGSSYPVVRDFDRFGRLQSIDYDDDSNTALVNFAYDVLGNRVNMTENNGTSDVRITDYLYDQSNRLTQVDFDTDGDSVVEETVSYDYDIRGLRTQLTMPGNLSIVYSYDAKGRLISLNDWDSQESQFKYDALNRHIGTLRPNGMRSIYKLDGAGRLRELRHENNMRETLAAFRYTVDGRGNRVQAQELTLAPNATPTTQTVQHTDSDKVLYTGTWTDTTSFHESTQWDARMALVSVGEDNVELTIGEGPDHSIFDLYIDGTLYESVDAYAASAGSRVVDIVLKGDGWHGLEIRNRHAKNMQSSGYKVRFASLSVDTALSETVIDYSYDSLSRLIEADYNNGGSVLNYGYDVAGNLIDLDGTTRVFNEANQMTNDGTNTLTYDNNGNLRTVGSDTYTWDRANRLLSVGNHSYIYDGLGNRVQQTVSSVVTDYLNDLQPGLTKLLKQTTGANVEHFVHAPRGIHAVDDGTDWNFYAQDGLGSVRAVVDDMAAVQTSMNFDPYGNPMGAYGAGVGYFGFTGEQTDASGYVFLRARYYEPQLSIFSALDPWEGISNRPMSLNGYSWVEGNVINAVDPTGRMPLGFSRESKGYGFRLNVKWNPIYWNLQNPFVIQSMNSGLCDDGGSVSVAGGNKRRYRHGGGFDIQQNYFCDNPLIPAEFKVGYGCITELSTPFTIPSTTPIPTNTLTATPTQTNTPTGTSSPTQTNTPTGTPSPTMPPTPTTNPNRELSVEEMAMVLGITGETGPLFDDSDRAVIVFVLQNRLDFPSSYGVPEQAIGTSQLAPFILTGFEGTNRTDIVTNAYNFFSGGESSSQEITERFNLADALVRRGVGTDFTGGALQFSHTDTPETARQIVEQIEGCGETVISDIIRSAGVDPIINGSQMVVGSSNISVYINMNYSLPFTVANAPNCS